MSIRPNIIFLLSIMEDIKITYQLMWDKGYRDKISDSFRDFDLRFP